MRAGQLRRYATIQHKVISGTGDRGQPVYTWFDKYERVPVGICDLQGRKLEIARQLVPTATDTISMRWKPIDTKNFRVNYNGTIYNIGDMHNPENRNLTMELIVTEEDPSSSLVAK